MEQPVRKELWPVMLTPFTASGEVDYSSLARMIDWYEEAGTTGLFAICQSSEVFYLSLAERVKIASFIKKRAHVPVIASGHTAWSPADQAEELRRITDTGVDALILITNRLAEEGSAPGVWMDNLERLLNALDPSLPLGFYECPMPYKRLLSLEELSACVQTGRFRFLKDTCCDIATICSRMDVLRGSSLGLYNANTATLLDSLKAGAAGFSGVMANFHPDLYAWLLAHYEDEPEKAEILQSVLTICSQIERQLYPTNAKYQLKTLGVLEDIYTRTCNHHRMSPLFEDEIRQMERMVSWVRRTLLAQA